MEDVGFGGVWFEDHVPAALERRIERNCERKKQPAYQNLNRMLWKSAAFAPLRSTSEGSTPVP